MRKSTQLNCSLPKCRARRSCFWMDPKYLKSKSKFIFCSDTFFQSFQRFYVSILNREEAMCSVEYWGQWELRYRSGRRNIPLCVVAHQRHPIIRLAIQRQEIRCLHCQTIRPRAQSSSQAHHSRARMARLRPRGACSTQKEKKFTQIARYRTIWEWVWWCVWWVKHL